MSETKRLDLRFGAFACSVQGFDDPVMPVQQVLRAIQHLLEETPELADAAINFDAEAIEQLVDEVARRAEVDESEVEIVPGLVIVHYGAGGSARVGSDEAGADAGPTDAGGAGFAPLFTPRDDWAGEPEDAPAGEGRDDGGELQDAFRRLATEDAGAAPASGLSPAGDGAIDKPGDVFAVPTNHAPGEGAMGADDVFLDPLTAAPSETPAEETTAFRDEEAEPTAESGTSGANLFARAEATSQEAAEDLWESRDDDAPVNLFAPAAADETETESAEEAEPVNLFRAADAGEDQEPSDALTLEEDGSAGTELPWRAAPADQDASDDGEPGETGAEDRDELKALFAAMRGGDAEPVDEDEDNVLPLDAAAAPDEEETYTAASLAERAGAEKVHELMVAAAAWMVLIKGQTQFTRKEVLEVFDTIPGDHPKSLEARFKGFGKAVRNGDLIMIGDGVYGISRAQLDRFEKLL